MAVCFEHKLARRLQVLPHSPSPDLRIMNGLYVPLSPASLKPGRKKSIPVGFRPAPKPKKKIDEMTLRELQDLYALNTRILSSPYVLRILLIMELIIMSLEDRGASTSTYVNRVSSEQAQIEARLVELDGMESINSALKNTRLKGEGDMAVDSSPEQPLSRAIEAKRKALSRFVRWSWCIYSKV